MSEPKTIALPVGRCMWCDLPVPETESDTMVYCSDTCRAHADAFASAWDSCTGYIDIAITEQLKKDGKL